MKSLNLDGVKFLIKTTYAGRRTQTPLFTVSAAGFCSLNSSFGEKYYNNHKSGLFVQAVNYKNVYYLLLSKTKKQGFYALSKIKGGGFQAKIKGLFTTFGKKGVAMRYSVELVETSDRTIKAFEVRPAAEDIFVTKEKSNFETV